MATIEFYFDFISPYSYVAFKLLTQLVEGNIWRQPVNIHYRPVRLAHLIGATANHPPASVPARAAFLALDLRRTCLAYALPFNPVKDFLQVPLKAASLLVTAAQEEERPHLVKLIWDEFFGIGRTDRLLSGDWRGILEGKSLMPVERIDELVKLIEEPHTMTQFKKVTDHALAEGAFGAPTMIVTNAQGERAFFFGSDRFHHIAIFLGEDPASPFTLIKSKF